MSTPTDNAPLVLFRIAFGFLVAVECVYAALSGWVHEVFVAPGYSFPLVGADWLRPLPEPGMQIYYLVMAAFGAGIMLGLRYRLSTILFGLMWTAAYLMQSVRYNNHFYLIILLSILMSLVPAHRDRSMDARAGRVTRAQACPWWCIGVFILQAWIVYTFAGVAKLDADWLAGRPVGIWFDARTDYPLIGGLYGQEWLRWIVVHGGLAFDLLVVPALLWRRTRLTALGVAVVFHLANSVTFGIGIFPYMALALCVFFFPGPSLRRGVAGGETPAGSPRAAPHRWRLAFLGIFFAVQLVLPLRHWLYPGNVNWTEEGHRMSWRMMLRTKRGSAYYVVRHPATRREWIVRPADRLPELQASRLARRPDMLWQYGQVIRREFAARGIAPVVINVHTRVSLNGREPQSLIDPAVDIGAARWSHLRHNPWIVPLREE